LKREEIKYREREPVKKGMRRKDVWGIHEVVTSARGQKKNGLQHNHIVENPPPKTRIPKENIYSFPPLRGGEV